MAVPFSQIVSSTYDAVVNEKNKGANQWSEASFLKTLESAGGVKRVPGGSTLSLTLDYQRNQGGDFLATDVTATGTSKTEVITQASYSFVPLVIPVNWAITDEALNSSANQKVDLVSTIVDNAIQSHDDMLEEAMFATSATDGFSSLPLLMTADGTGTVGTIVSGTETWFKSKFGTFTDDTDIEASMTTLWNSCAKGSGSMLAPTVIVSNSTSQALFEANLQPFQRYEGGKVGNSGFKSLKFKDADYVFSKYGTNDVYMLNPKNLKLYVVQGAFRQRREAVEHVNALMMNMKVWSLVQIATNNRSRLGVIVKS